MQGRFTRGMVLRLIGLAMLSVLAACSSIPVSTDYDTSRDFSALKTYTWMEPKARVIIDPLVDNDLMAARIRKSVDEHMASRGYVKATGDTAADFHITYQVGSKEKLDVQSYHTTFGYYPCWGCYGPGFGGSDIYVRQYTEGSFMLDVIDPASQQLIWRGVAARRLQGSGTPQERDLFISEVVSAILADFPPGGVANSAE